MRGYKFMLVKAWFDKGYALTNYVKYPIAYLGLKEWSTTFTIKIAFAYVVMCFIVGYIWYKHGYIEAENEVNNAYNLFQKEVRETIGNGKVFK